MSKKTIVCIVKSSQKIKDGLKNRFKELGLNYSDIVEDSKEQDHPIDLSSLSRYLNKEAYVKGGLSQEHIIFLCMRYCIDIRLYIKTIPYSEELARKNLKKYFNLKM